MPKLKGFGGPVSNFAWPCLLHCSFDLSLVPMLRRILSVSHDYRLRSSEVSASKGAMRPKKRLNQNRGQFRYRHQLSWSVGGPDYEIPRALANSILKVSIEVLRKAVLTDC